MEKINIAEILRNCPQGMELDCTLFDDDVTVIFDGVDVVNEYATIIKITVIHDGNRSKHTLTKYGQWNPYKYAKCVIFPKGKTTWEGFVPPFKDGDILVTDLGSIFILKEPNEKEYHYSCYIALNDASQIIKSYTQFCTKKGCRLATEEEKAKLLKAIEDKGYKWNAETKILEKLVEPKFKVGDRIQNIYNGKQFTITKIYQDYYECDDRYVLAFENQDIWELVPDKFDINTLVPFDSRVLVRNSKDQYWVPAFWGYKAKDGYVTTFGHCNYCIPFEENEHLLKTKNDCNEYFKTWE